MQERSSKVRNPSAGESAGPAPQARNVAVAAEKIRYASGPCSLGSVLVAATDLGVLAILLGDSRAGLKADLRARFPRAALSRKGAELGGWLALATGMVDDPGGNRPAPPLDIRGTAFRRRVWEAVAAIPPGATVTYGVMAAGLGVPGAARAVAGACAANPMAVAVPCHRVVAADGGMAGYRWGAWRKRALLRRERAGA